MRRLRITLGFFVSMAVVFSSCSKHAEYRYNATYQRTDMAVNNVSQRIPTAYNFNVVLQSINGEQIQ